MKTLMQLFLLLGLSLGINLMASGQNTACSECAGLLNLAEKIDSSHEKNIDKQIVFVNNALTLLKQASKSNGLSGAHGKEVISAVLYLMTSAYKFDVHNLTAEVVLEMYKKEVSSFNAVINSLPDNRKQLVKNMLGLAKKVDEKGNG